MLKMTHLTAERRVRAIFIWAHVLGTRAEVIVQPCRMHAKVAVAALQILLIAVRGHRPYSFRELVVIFKHCRVCPIIGRPIHRIGGNRRLIGRPIHLLLPPIPYFTSYF